MDLQISDGNRTYLFTIPGRLFYSTISLPLTTRIGASTSRKTYSSRMSQRDRRLWAAILREQRMEGTTSARVNKFDELFAQRDRRLFS